MAGDAAQQDHALLSQRSRHPEARWKPVSPPESRKSPSVPCRCTRANGRRCEATPWWRRCSTAIGTSTRTTSRFPGTTGRVPRSRRADTFTQFVTGDHLSDQRVEDYFRNHFEGLCQPLRIALLGPGHAPVEDRVRLSVRRVSSQERSTSRRQLSSSTTRTGCRLRSTRSTIRSDRSTTITTSASMCRMRGQCNRRLNLSLGVRYAHDNAYAPAQCLGQTDFAPAAVLRQDPDASLELVGAAQSTSRST